MIGSMALEVLLTGISMSPEEIRSKDIAEVIKSMENMIASMAARQNPTLKKGSIAIGLKSIRPGTIELEFPSSLAEITLPAAQCIAKSIMDNDFGALPAGVMKSLKKISSFTRKYKCSAEFLENNESSKALITLTPQTRIPDTHSLSGETTIYGEITRVGGAEPKIQFRTLDKKVIYCIVSKSLARKAGERLYANVELHGTATWNLETFEIEKFIVEDISDHEKSVPSKAFEELSKLVGDSFDHVEDVNHFVSEMRYGPSEK
jgi:hypothetical protein